MKRTVRFLFVVGIAICAIVAMRLWLSPRMVVRSQLHPLYLRYEHSSDIAAGFVKDLRLNDSVTIDVVTLAAADTAAWFRMLGAINVKDEMIDYLREINYNNISNFALFTIPKDNPSPSSDGYYGTFNMVVCTPEDMTVCVYDVVDSLQYSIIIDIELDNIAT